MLIYVFVQALVYIYLAADRATPKKAALKSRPDKVSNIVFAGLLKVYILLSSNKMSTASSSIQEMSVKKLGSLLGATFWEITICRCFSTQISQFPH